MKGKAIRVLVVDDEPSMRRSICLSLAARGYAVSEARNGEEAIIEIRENRADVVLLDINMPGIGGIEACRQIRSSSPDTAIVMVTVRDSEDDTVTSLEAGADDYITKPFRSRELIARVAAVTRRSLREEATPACVLRAGKLELDASSRSVRKAGTEIRLSPIEFNLLKYFMENKGVALEHSKLLRTIWGPEYGHELDYLRTYIRLIRKKIEDDPGQPEYITTEPWLGYRFRDPSEHDQTN